MYRQPDKNLFKQQFSSTCPHNMVDFGPLMAEIVWRVWGTRANFSYIGSVTARHSSSGRQPNCSVQQTAPPIFGRAAIMLGIGPHSSLFVCCYFCCVSWTICKSFAPCSRQITMPKLSAEVLTWSSVWSEVQMISIWSS